MRGIRKALAVRATSTLLVAVTVGAAGTSCATARSEGSTYCAMMPDTIGLYVGNPVTQMGYRIGEITSVTAGPESVRVDFAVTEKRPLPDDVKAVIRSPSILADRSLELVGNYSGGPQLQAGGCVPLDRSMSPKTLSEVIGSADTFLDAINPEGSTNIADTVRGLDQLIQGNGADAGSLVTRTSALLDSPDQSIADMGSIIGNLAELTTALKDMRDPLKQVLQDARTTTGDVATALDGTARLAGTTELGNLGPLIEAVAVLETRLGDETQLTLDTLSASVRKATPHANAFAALLNPVPWWINSAAQHYNERHFNVFNIAYRPPMYRVRAHDGLALCGFMNSSVPGSCADVNGIPYAVDVALLQYVLMEANRR
ncbi:MlaD family protein [Mycolicibacterium parafortuitum]|uniref:ABC-type transport system involved in resistance to organic solvents, periplasmic component [Gordonia sp. KTR9] n=1 Tax=Mycolicibacterium parafortuitum TaxID=39692 RepID=A0A375YEP1_MYCPF|nr:MlaD family protein [Mycolicibacterium parafortuitum]ORB30242.1 mammalian cell entry protein [Mycolicibacterium parafortuitum]SRX79597.1 ABC-type transport system involved in resistance to organic solvents, periplasmic component [Gordonia sp. KTR9] [Mycolicibacterium parafortuitum]